MRRRLARCLQLPAGQQHAGRHGNRVALMLGERDSRRGSGNSAIKLGCMDLERIQENEWTGKLQGVFGSNVLLNVRLLFPVVVNDSITSLRFNSINGTIGVKYGFDVYGLRIARNRGCLGKDCLLELPGRSLELKRWLVAYRTDDGRMLR